MCAGGRIIADPTQGKLLSANLQPGEGFENRLLAAKSLKDCLREMWLAKFSKPHERSIAGVRSRIREFLEENIAPLARSMGDKEVRLKRGEDLQNEIDFPAELPEIYRLLGIAGYFELGMQDTLLKALLLMELTRIEPGIALSIEIDLAVVEMLSRDDRFIESGLIYELTAGEKLCAFCLTEPGAGSDAAALRTGAVFDEGANEWVLNGTKLFITNPPLADVYIVFAKTGEKEISAFLLEKGTPGLAVAKLEKKLGLGLSPTAEVVLEDCRVPAENMVSLRGKGLEMAKEILYEGRILIGALSTALMESSLEALGKIYQRAASTNYSLARKGEEFDLEKVELAAACGSPKDKLALLGQGVTLGGLAKMWAEVRAMRALVYDAALMDAANEQYAATCSAAKFIPSEACVELTGKAFTLASFLASGMGSDSEVQELLLILEGNVRAAPAMKIGEGTSEVQLMIISHELVKNSM